MRLLLLFLFSIVGGCAPTSKESLETVSSARVLAYKDNYQEIFRRVSNSAKRCYEGDFIIVHGRINVNAQLYNELAYGEVHKYMEHALFPAHYFTAKIEKDENGTRVTIKANKNLEQAYEGKIDGWARGSTGC